MIIDLKTLTLFFLLPVFIAAATPVDTVTTNTAEMKSSNSARVVTIGCLVEAATILSPNQPIPYFGAGNFIQGNWNTGLFFLGSELGLIYLRNNFNEKIGEPNFYVYPDVSNNSVFQKRNGLSSSNFAQLRYKDLTTHTLFYIRMIDFYTSYKSLHDNTTLTNKVQLPDKNIPELMISPIKPKYLSNPWVYIPVLLAGGVTYFGTQNDKPLSSAQDISMYNKSFSPASAEALYGGIQSYRYAMVAAGEEMFFRGSLQTELTEQTNPTTALIVSSLLFGAWHIPNNGVMGGVAATAGGFYLGYRYQNSGYDLGEVIALHFWLDFLPSIIEFYKNPKTSQIVYTINWKL